MKLHSKRDINHKSSLGSLQVLDIVTIGMLSAMLLAVQVALAALPNIELVTLLIVLYTLIYGRKTVYIIYIFALLEGILYGFGLWWYGYLYVWTILFIIASMFKQLKSVQFWAIITGLFGLLFGALYSIPYFIFGGIGAGISYWIAGIPFDLIHGGSNFIVTFALFRPLHYALNKFKGV
jgi:energy-coupling factor transport system substrate-specific component